MNRDQIIVRSQEDADILRQNLASLFENEPVIDNCQLRNNIDNVTGVCKKLEMQNEILKQENIQFKNCQDELIKYFKNHEAYLNEIPGTMKNLVMKQVEDEEKKKKKDEEEEMVELLREYTYSQRGAYLLATDWKKVIAAFGSMPSYKTKDIMQRVGYRSSQGGEGNRWRYSGLSLNKEAVARKMKELDNIVKTSTRGFITPETNPGYASPVPNSGSVSPAAIPGGGSPRLPTIPIMQGY